MIPMLSVADHQCLYELIQARLGVNLTDNQRNDVLPVVESLLTSTGFNGLLDALAEAPVDNPQWQQIVNVVTVGETYFFRNQYQFDALRTAILPALVDERRKAGFKQLRLWSAGCAGGEEPYSLAILLRDMLPDIDSWSITILATDINAASLEHARAGLYRAWSFRSETPADIRDRWFRLTTNGYQLSSKIRSMVTFAPLNLVSDDYPSYATGTMNMDIILCRNVTIYFDQATTREIVGRFQRALTEDGWLVVGHAEPMAVVYEDWFTPRNFDNTVLYQKRRAGPEAPSVSCAVTTETVTAGTPAMATMLVTPAPVAPAVPAKRTAPLPEPDNQVVTTPEPPPVEEPDCLQRAKQAADREDWDEALRWLAEAEQQDRLHPHVHYLRGLVQWHGSNPDSALSSLRQAVYCDPHFALAHYTLAELYEHRGEVKEAIRYLRLAQAAIADMEPDQPVSFGEDLTVGMLQELLTYRLNRLLR